MATNTITTSLVIQFADPSEGASGAVLQAEIDSRPEGYNQGNTTFVPGNSPAYLVYKTSDVSFTTESTDGNCGMISGSVPIEITEYITFAKSSEASLAKPPSGNSVTFTFIGGTGAGLTVKGTRVTTTSNTKILAVYKAEYTTVAQAWRLNGATDPVVVIFLDGVVTPQV